MSFVHVEDRSGGVRLLRLDHGKPNALSETVLDELSAALEAARKGTNALVLTGRPGMFSAGFDLGTLGAGPAAAASMVKAGGRMLMEIYDHPKPIVAACSGHAIAMGLFTVLACDYRVGARGGFKIGANETAIGMTLPDFAVELVRASVSKRHVDRALVQSETYDPEGAVDAGMLDEVVDPDTLEARALEVATRLGALPQPAYRNNKGLSHRALVERVRSGLEENIGRLMSS